MGSEAGRANAGCLVGEVMRVRMARHGHRVRGHHARPGYDGQVMKANALLSGGVTTRRGRLVDVQMSLLIVIAGLIVIMIGGPVTVALHVSAGHQRGSVV